MRIYYSRSNEVEDNKYLPLIYTFMDNLPEYNNKEHVLTAHKRGNVYNPELVDLADLIIVAVPKEGTNFNPYFLSSFIAKGCYTEIMSALEASKPVLLLSKFTSSDYFVQRITKSDISLGNVANWKTGYAKIFHRDRVCNPESKQYLQAHIDSRAEIDRIMLMMMTGLFKKESIRDEVESIISIDQEEDEILLF
jgi:hypothetical protein